MSLETRLYCMAFSRQRTALLDTAAAGSYLKTLGLRSTVHINSIVLHASYGNFPHLLSKPWKWASWCLNSLKYRRIYPEFLQSCLRCAKVPSRTRCLSHILCYVWYVKPFFVIISSSHFTMSDFILFSSYVICYPALFYTSRRPGTT